MKTLKIPVIGMLLIFSGAAIAQVNNGVIINNNDTTKVVQTDTVKVTKTDTVKVKEVQVVEVPRQEEPKVEKSEPTFHSGEFGVRFMPSFTTLQLKNSNGTTVKGDVSMSYGYGALIGINSKHVGLQLEVIYNAISQKYKDKELERKIDINYINVPLLLTLNTDKSKAVNLSVGIGPQVGINVGSRVVTTGGNNADTLHAALAVKKGDFGFAYGAGLEFALNPSRTFRLDLGFRGVYGLIDISDRSRTRATNSYYILDRTNIETYAGYIGFSFMF